MNIQALMEEVSMDFTINMMENGRVIPVSQAAAIAAYQAQQTAHLIPMNGAHQVTGATQHQEHQHSQVQHHHPQMHSSMHDEQRNGMIETKPQLIAKDEVEAFTPPPRVGSVGSVVSHPDIRIEKGTDTTEFEPQIKVEIRGPVPGFAGNDKDKTGICYLQFNNPNELIHYFSQRAVPQLDAFNLLTNSDLIRNINPDIVRNHFLYVQNGQENVRIAPNGYQATTANPIQVTQNAQASAGQIMIAGASAAAPGTIVKAAARPPIKTERRRGEVPPGTIINKTPPIENNPNQFVCWICGQNQQKSLPFEEHMVEQHNIEKPYRCEDCGVTFKQKAHIDRHKRIHLPTRPYQCGVCGKGFTRNEHVRRHSFTHSGEKPYECPSCSKTFSRQQQLSKHLLTHAKPPRPDSPQHPCHSTGLTTTLLLQTTDQSGRLITINQGTQGLPIGQSLTTQGSVLGQSATRGRSIAGEPVARPYQCGVCGKAFIRNEHLRRHMLIHSGEKPHVCGSCGKAFPRREHLTKHMRSHSKDPQQASPVSMHSTIQATGTLQQSLPAPVGTPQPSLPAAHTVMTSGIPAGVSVVTSGHQPVAAHSGAASHAMHTVPTSHPTSLPPGTHYLPMFGLLAEVV